MAVVAFCRWAAVGRWRIFGFDCDATTDAVAVVGAVSVGGCRPVAFVVATAVAAVVVADRVTVRAVVDCVRRCDDPPADDVWCVCYGHSFDDFG